eukprot:TRINITY_DN291_c0_g1_i3.p1 TRINITY_DN291_c0_g1~~TRINITY_DN291_c0_g1_i3.p1  ORF type:complete len:322 (+),score=66.85 TRINITY_DN291_c0_g1_i3:148-1113(+)
MNGLPMFKAEEMHHSHMIGHTGNYSFTCQKINNSPDTGPLQLIRMASSTLSNNPTTTFIRAKRPSKPKKANKPLPTSVRAGDWVCILCNNLNFSFRNECNRCQMQTKKQNHLQNLLMIKDPASFGREGRGSYPRKPLEDLTNRELTNGRDDEQVENFKARLLETPFGKENVRPGNSGGISWLRGISSKKSGFETVLFLTPPRVTTLEMATPSNEKAIEGRRFNINPYKSPINLPSVSPFLQRLMSGEFAHPTIEPFSIEEDETTRNEDGGAEEKQSTPTWEISRRLILDDSEENFEEIQRSINEMVFSSPSEGRPCTKRAD